MSRPVLFALDDDAGVVRALRGDLSRRFSRDFRVLGESSAAAGLATLRQLAGHGEPVALLIVDHHMTEMPGLEFLARAHELHPSAKRVLLVERDYSVRSPVVQAMTLGQADYHLSKPWMLEQDLYLAVSEFLAEWARDQDAGFDLFHVIGGLQDRGTNELRELLIRFNVPFRFTAADSEPGRRLLTGHDLKRARVPIMIRHDGYTMVDPTSAQVVAVVGGSTHSDISQCDVAIVGAGPAGLAAAVYAASEGLRTVVLEEAVSGGQAGSSPMIRNYPGLRTASAGTTSPAGRASRPGSSGRTWCSRSPSRASAAAAASGSCTWPTAGTPGNGGHRRLRRGPPGGPDPARQAERPARASVGGRVVRADRRRALHPVAPEGGSAGQRLHPDRGGHRPGRPRPVPVAARPRAAPARDLHPGHLRGRRCRYRSIKRVASAVGDGATAVRIAHEYLAARYG
jgi:ActR/RegA family two-component response regulator